MAYSFVDASGRNNGNVVSINPAAWHWNWDSASYSYDSLNRIATAVTPFDYSVPYWGPLHCYGEQFGYDAWGNLLSISPVSSAYNGCTQENLSVAVNAKNQIVGYTYDAAGNLIATPPPGAANYTYNAENQLTATAGVSYTYDGDGKRVMKSTGKTYWYGMGSDVLYENDGAGHWYNYFYFDGRRISRPRLCFCRC